MGGAATGLQCSGCVVADAIADGAVAASKVGFTYAGSASKGGPADLALKAAVAVSADSAASADELKCVGCIDLKHIAPGVAKGFLVSKGPATFTGDLTVTGALAANGGLNLAGSLLSNAALHTGDAKTAKCTPAELGRLLLDEASARIHFCDGKKFQRLAVCADTCLPAVGVACGLPIASGCGDTVGCTGTGTACPGVAQCTAKGCKLLGDDSDTPGKTCLDVRNAGSKDDGAYWIDADGAGGLAPMKVYCDMTSDGGGWTLVAYAPDQKTQNLWALDVGGGVYDGVTRTAAGSLPAVAIAKLSTEMLLARSDSDGYKGNIAGTTAASKYKIPVPTTVNFVNPNPVAGNTGTRGACSSVTVTTVVGPNATGQTRYWFVNSLGVTWTDTYPTQYGAISTTNCVNDDSGKGPSFATVFSGVKNPGQTVGDPKYWHMGWWDAVGANKSGTALIFLR
ncbi:MAG: hypothetical protein EXR79_17410 [Myxococcales bacterium]|nr:hypothetical protein [Myxococcales bacterium]